MKKILNQAFLVLTLALAMSACGNENPRVGEGDFEDDPSNTDNSGNGGGFTDESNNTGAGYGSDGEDFYINFGDGTSYTSF